MKRDLVAGGEPGAKRPALNRQGARFIQAGLPPAAANALRRTLSGLNVVEHPELPAGATVRLYPRVELTGDRISAVVISRLQRTPSPFGSRMGDHTVAWQAVVDSVHARLHGLTVADAVVALRKRQLAVSSWMGRTGSAGMKLLEMLEDRATRTPLLEDSCWRVDQELKQVAGASPADLAHLQKAVAQHLAYVNYLPFATVPAKVARGSHGSGEGTYRRQVLDLERAGTPVLVPPAPAQVGGPEGMRDALWRLFAFDAAIREADVEFAVVPSALTDIAAANTELKELAQAAVAACDVVLRDGLLVSNKSERAKRREADLAAGLLPPAIPPLLSAAEVDTRLKPYLSNKPQYKEFRTLALKIREAYAAVALVPNPARADEHDALDAAKQGVAQWLAASAQLEADLRARGDALRGASVILAHLLHDHQVTVAQAYPRTVQASKFLGPSPAEAATQRLRAEIDEQIPLASPDRVQVLLDAVEAGIGSLEPPVVAQRNEWVQSAATTELAVAYPDGGPLQITGRAPAPAGVEGMGSHTTAWVVERVATDALVSGARSTAGAVTALQDHVVRDLAGPVMALDWLLPTEQLVAGQLQNIFDTALEVFAATEVPAAVTAYLCFRNLLPYATVDAGDRGGHGESMTASKEKLFDRASLRNAADLKTEELMAEDRRGKAARALTRVAGRLLRHPNPAWAGQENVRDAVAASIVRLNQASAALAGGAPADAELATLIEETRDLEHSDVHTIALSSRLQD